MDVLYFHSTLEGLCSLESLVVDVVDEWHFRTGVALPTSLTRLCLKEQGADIPPSQIGALCNLRSLEFHQVEYDEESYGCLLQLSSLRHLVLARCTLPVCLPDLTGLHTLKVCSPSGSDQAATAALAVALLRLGQLTGLWLSAVPLSIVTLPALASLSRLQWASLLTIYPDDAEAPAVLPCGPWQRSLQHLEITSSLALASPAFLQGAEQLQRISFFDAHKLGTGADEGQWRTFWNWAAYHPPLQCINLWLQLADCPVKLMQASLEMRNRRPGLHISVITDSSAWEAVLPPVAF